MGEENSGAEPLIAGEGAMGGTAMVAGTCIATEAERMKKLLFRVTRGMAASYFNQFEQEGVQRCAYLVIFNNNPQDKLRVQKVCDSFNGTKIEVPELGAMQEQINETKKSIVDSESMLLQSKRGVKAYLHSLNYTVPNPDTANAISALEVHKWLVVKEKAIYMCLNQMRDRQGTFIGFMWAPFEDQGDIHRCLTDFQTTTFMAYCNDNNNEIGGTVLNPPTYFKANDVTVPFQMITNMYGVPSYGEANPAPFAIITFPFFFGMMFGDYGHGSLIFFAGLMLTMFYNQLKNTAAAPILAGRYFMLAMGMCSMYNGLLYNEFFAIPNDWFGSCYDLNTRLSISKGDVKNFVYPPKVEAGKHFVWNGDKVPTPRDPKAVYSSEYKGNDCVYAFGTDPAWFLSP